MLKVLLTGSSGMLGRNILAHNVVNRFKLLTPSSKDLNLLDCQAIERFLDENPIDIIVHCAGYVGGIQANLSDPVSFLNLNLVMGMNLVNSAFKKGVKKQ